MVFTFAQHGVLLTCPFKKIGDRDTISVQKVEVAWTLPNQNLMDADTLINLAEQILQRRLESLERFVLQQSWEKRTYAQMAQTSSYGAEYVKHVGFKLWAELSKALNEAVGKKNLHLVFTATRFPQLLSPEADLPLQPVAQLSLAKSNVIDQSAAGRLTIPSGPVPLDSPLYIRRSPPEETAFNEICYPGCLLRIKAPRRMGKSSLLNRLLNHATTQGYRQVKLNLNEVDATTFLSLDRFLRWFCANLSLKLNLPSQVDALWDKDIGSKVNCKLYVERYIFSKISEPIVLGIDELNRVFEYAPTAHDFLPMLRVWHEQSKDDLAWRNLRLVLAHATDFYIPLKLNQSPFNVGLSISLPPFTLAQLQELAGRYGLESLMQGSRAWQLKSLHYLIDGHPYLAGLAFYALCRKQTTLNEILGAATTPNSIYRRHLQQCLATLQSDLELACLYYRVISADDGLTIDAISAYKLESLGLIRFENTLVKPSCDLYRRYFGEQLRSACG